MIETCDTGLTCSVISPSEPYLWSTCTWLDHINSSPAFRNADEERSNCAEAEDTTISAITIKVWRRTPIRNAIATSSLLTISCTVSDNRWRSCRLKMDTNQRNQLSRPSKSFWIPLGFMIIKLTQNRTQSLPGTARFSVSIGKHSCGYAKSLELDLARTALSWVGHPVDRMFTSPYDCRFGGLRMGRGNSHTRIYTRLMTRF